MQIILCLKTYIRRSIRLSDFDKFFCYKISFIILGDCYDKKCSGHGLCQNAQCICDIGWIGRNCERRNSVLMQCLPDCSSHGDFDVESGKCNCHDHWTGRECNISKFCSYAIINVVNYLESL